MLNVIWAGIAIMVNIFSMGTEIDSGRTFAREKETKHEVSWDQQAKDTCLKIS